MSKHAWVHELNDTSGSAIGYRTMALLHRERTPFQTIEIYQSSDFGRLMALDGCWMVTERDNFIYHEMMAHPALFAHRDPRAIAIIGGGDCGTLREVLRHDRVRQATQIEIDRRVTELSEQYFPELCMANNDPRSNLVFDDGIAWIGAQTAATLDVLIVDSTDPVGPAADLFELPFLRACARVLRPHGILVQQSESPLLHVELLTRLRQRLAKAGFDTIAHLLFPQPCYPSGWWSCTLAGKAADLTAFAQDIWDKQAFATRYYNAEIHRSARAMPEFLRAALGT